MEIYAPWLEPRVLQHEPSAPQKTHGARIQREKDRCLALPEGPARRRRIPVQGIGIRGSRLRPGIQSGRPLLPLPDRFAHDQGHDRRTRREVLRLCGASPSRYVQDQGRRQHCCRIRFQEKTHARRGSQGHIQADLLRRLPAQVPFVQRPRARHRHGRPQEGPRRIFVLLRNRQPEAQRQQRHRRTHEGRGREAIRSPRPSSPIQYSRVSPGSRSTVTRLSRKS